MILFQLIATVSFMSSSAIGNLEVVYVLGMIVIALLFLQICAVSLMYGYQKNKQNVRKVKAIKSKIRTIEDCYTISLYDPEKPSGSGKKVKIHVPTTSIMEDSDD